MDTQQSNYKVYLVAALISVTISILIGAATYIFIEQQNVNLANRNLGSDSIKIEQLPEDLMRPICLSAGVVETRGLSSTDQQKHEEFRRKYCSNYYVY